MILVLNKKTHNTNYMYIQYIQMKENKEKQFHLRLSNNEEWLLESIANSMNCSMSKAIINSLILAERYLIKGKNWKPILTLTQKNDINEFEQKLLNKIGASNIKELTDIANINWLDE